MAFDQYDEEIVKIAKVYAWMNDTASRTRNTQENLQEFGKRIQDEFNKIGMLVNVDMTPAAIINPATGQGGSPIVEIIGRADDPFNEKQYDHDRKRAEVLRSREHGVKYDGLQGGFVNKGRTVDARRKNK